MAVKMARIAITASVMTSTAIIVVLRRNSKSISNPLFRI
jgi:hypothetical protein